MIRSLAIESLRPPNSEDEFEWPDDLNRCALAATSSYLQWLKEIGETGEMSWRHLKTLYLEYCCIARRKPLSDRVLQMKLKKCGVTSKRPKVVAKAGALHRPSVYMI